MITYLKKLLSRKYKHKYSPLDNDLKYMCQCLKCNRWKHYYFNSLSICSISEDEWIIKNILE